MNGFQNVVYCGRNDSAGFGKFTRFFVESFFPQSGKAEDFQYATSATYSSTYPTDDNRKMQECATKTLERIFKEGYEYRKAGIILSGLVPAEKLSKRMFDDEKFERQHKLMKAVDEINQKFGKDTVRFGGIVRNGVWKMKQIYKSPSYTTNWNELLTVG